MFNAVNVHIVFCVSMSYVLHMDTNHSEEQAVTFLWRQYFPPKRWYPRTKLNVVRFEAFTAWLWRMSSSGKWGRLQPPARAGSPLADSSTLKMEAIRSSETSVNGRSTQRHIPEEDILQTKRCHNPENHNMKIKYLTISLKRFPCWKIIHYVMHHSSFMSR
jgi:hypothetical protein